MSKAITVVVPVFYTPLFRLLRRFISILFLLALLKNFVLIYCTKDLFGIQKILQLEYKKRNVFLTY